jgi:hypothetical protein
MIARLASIAGDSSLPHETRKRAGSQLAALGQLGYDVPAGLDRVSENPTADPALPANAPPDSVLPANAQLKRRGIIRFVTVGLIAMFFTFLNGIMSNGILFGAMSALLLGVVLGVAYLICFGIGAPPPD